MIRDPSDGTVRKSNQCTPANRDTDLIPASGLPITKDKAEYLARLEKSRDWLKTYRERT